MKVTVHDTLRIYQKMIRTASEAERETIFRNELLTPFVSAIASMAGSTPDKIDVLDMVRIWGFLLSDDLDHDPPALRLLEEHDAWAKSNAVLETCTQQFAAYDDQIGLDEITYGLFLGHPETNPFNRGYTGFGGIPGVIFAVYSQPNTYNLSKLSGLVAHEFHHNIQFSVFPWDHAQVSLAQWMIYEGMAESFATELYGDEMLGYYVTDFDTMQLEETKSIIQQHFAIRGFNTVRSYIYGDALADKFGFEKVGVPAFAGYAIGYHIVQAYLKKQNASVVQATFVHPEVIIEQSGFFAG